MTDFKVGDKVRWIEKEDHDVFVRTIMYYGPQAVVYGSETSSKNYHEYYQARSTFDLNFELVPQKFEVGKTYRQVSDMSVFKVEWADDYMAFGRNPSRDRGGLFSYYQVRHSAFPKWEEIG